MSERLKILYGQDRAPYPSFTESELVELLGGSKKKNGTRAKAENWQCFDVKEIDADGDIDSYPVWDALSMPEETRLQIAIGHYTAEEEDNPLLAETETEAQQVRFYFPDVSLPVIRAAIYRSRQISMILDVIESLQLSIKQAFKAIAVVYRIDFKILFDLVGLFLTGSKPFLLLREDTRLLLLVHHFSTISDELLPEFPSLERLTDNNTER